MIDDVSIPYANRACVDFMDLYPFSLIFCGIK